MEIKQTGTTVNDDSIRDFCLPLILFLAGVGLLLAINIPSSGTSHTNGPVHSPTGAHGADVRFTTKKIEDLEAGDLVVARDPKTGEVRHKRVLRAFRRTSDHLRILEIDSASGEKQRIETTDEHPFWVTGRGFVNAGELQAGDKLDDTAGPNGAFVVTSIREEHPDGVEVCNFEVEDFHTYFVRAGGTRGPPLFVHNAKCDVPRPVSTRPSHLSVGQPLPDDELVTIIGGNSPGRFKLGRADSLPIENVTAPGKSASIAVDLTPEPEILQTFGRQAQAGDIVLGAQVRDIRNAGFDVVFAPTRSNPLHVRIIEHTARFTDAGSEELFVVFERLGKKRR